MKRLFNLDKFAFVDENGLIYTATGTQNNVEDYGFDYRNLSGAEVSLYRQEGGAQQVIIAEPVDLPFEGGRLCVCFMAINMDEMLSGLSMSSNPGDTTFCNLYTSEGRALTESVLGGLAAEDNLLSAMGKADIEPPYSYERFLEEFQSGRRGVVSFSYNGIRETLSYTPVEGTDWQLTYLIRESVISERISDISRGNMRRSILQSVLTVAVMGSMFVVIFSQNKPVQPRALFDTLESLIR